MLRLTLRISALVAACMLAACNSDALPPEGQYASVSGVVLDRATNQPIAGATVIVDTVLTATTDAQGHFTIDKVPSGIVDYTISAKGYSSLTASGNAEPGKPFTVNAALATGPQ